MQVTWTSLLTGGCLLLNESGAESSCMSFLDYFHAAISNHLSEKPKIYLVYMVAKHRFDYNINVFFTGSSTGIEWSLFFTKDKSRLFHMVSIINSLHTG